MGVLPDSGAYAQRMRGREQVSRIIRSAEEVHRLRLAPEPPPTCRVIRVVSRPRHRRPPRPPPRSNPAGRGRVRRWRGVCRIRCVARQLSRRHSVRLPWIRFHPLPSELSVRISRTQLSSGIMHLAHGTPVQNSFQPCQSLAVPVGMAPARFQKSHASIRVVPRRRAIEPVHAPTAPDLPSAAGPAPSLTHLMLPDSSPFHAGS